MGSLGVASGSKKGGQGQGQDCGALIAQGWGLDQSHVLLLTHPSDGHHFLGQGPQSRAT